MFVMLHGFPPFSADFNTYGYEQNARIEKIVQQGFIAEVKDGFGPWFSKELKMSEEAQDLLSKLLHSDTAQRFTAKEALQHPWILNAEKSNNAVINATKIDDFGRKFVASEQFRNAIKSLFRDKYEKLKVDDVFNFRFAWIDMVGGGDDNIDFKTLKAGLLQIKELDLKEDEFDKYFESDGMDDIQDIDVRSFVDTLTMDYMIYTDRRMYERFRDLDEHESCRIQTNHLRQTVREMKPFGRTDYLLRMIEIHDLDNDGHIDYEDYLRTAIPDINTIPDWFRGKKYFVMLVYGYICFECPKPYNKMIPNELKSLVWQFYNASVF